jgi:hypothetical protein
VVHIDGAGQARPADPRSERGLKKKEEKRKRKKKGKAQMATWQISCERGDTSEKQTRKQK